MKKIICFTLAASLALLFSCGKEADLTDSTVKDIPNSPITEEAEASDTETADTSDAGSSGTDTAETEPQPEARLNVSYGVIDNPQSYSKLNVYVRFPILEGTVNDELANSIIKNSVNAFITADTQLLASGGEELTYEIDDVTATYLGKNFASFLFIGNYYVAESAHPTEFVRTLNIDIASGRVVELKDICGDINELSELFEEYEVFSLIPSTNATADKEVSEMSRDRITAATMFYFIKVSNDVRFAVSAEIPHALGDHAEYEAKLSDIDYLFTDEIITLTKGSE